jgi:hypothetical protein
VGHPQFVQRSAPRVGHPSTQACSTVGPERSKESRESRVASNCNQENGARDRNGGQEYNLGPTSCRPKDLYRRQCDQKHTQQRHGDEMRTDVEKRSPVPTHPTKSPFEENIEQQQENRTAPAAEIFELSKPIALRHGPLSWSQRVKEFLPSTCCVALEVARSRLPIPKTVRTWVGLWLLASILMLVSIAVL